MRLTLTELIICAQPYTDPRIGLTPEFATAVAWVESGGDTSAVGDRGRAVGLLQFHPETWVRCTRRPWMDRHFVDANFLAFQAECREAARKLKARKLPVTPTALANYHNQGSLRTTPTAYSRRLLNTLACITQIEWLFWGPVGERKEIPWKGCMPRKLPVTLTALANYHNQGWL